MNKLLLLGLGAALAFSGCRRSEFGSEGSDENTIRFTTEAVSKGTVVVSDVQLSTMGVFCSATELDAWSASAHAPNKMFHVKMKNTNEGVNGATASAWDYAVASEKQYWGTGLGSRFTFFAYAPYGTGAGGNGISMVSSAATKGVPVIRYEAPAKVTDRPDLMVATPRTNIHPVSAVGLKMGHALSKLTFSAKLPAGEAAMGIKVSSITIVKAQFEGTLPLAYPLTWTVDYNVLKERNISADAVLDNTVELTDEMQSVTKAGEALFMLPQPMNPNKPGLTPIKLMVAFEVDGEEYEPDDAPYELTGSWEPGKAYDYQITYVPGTKTVDLSVKVTDWAGTVDMEAKEGTYLRVAERSMTAYVGMDNALFYSTDYTGTVVCTVKSAPGGSTLTAAQGTGCLLLNPDQVGTYVVVLKAGNLSTEVPVTATTAPWVRIGDLFWAAGNLVASSNTAGASGAGGCKIGAPTDGGLYFQFGGLIGWKGGSLANGGTGVGATSYTGSGTTWWGGVGLWNGFANQAHTWPMEMTATPTAWRSNLGSTAGDRTGLSDYYFNYNVTPYSTAHQDIRGFAVSIPGDSGTGTLADGRYAPLAVGDPCTYYLGGTWRLPTSAEFLMLLGANGANTNKTVPLVHTASGLSFPASGYRSGATGAFHGIPIFGYYWSSTVFDASGGYRIDFSGVPKVQEHGERFHAKPARCVADPLLADRTNVVIPVGGGSETVNVSAFNGASWTASASGAGLSVSPTSGSGNGPITVRYPELASGCRAGTVTLTSGSATVTIAVSQRTINPPSSGDYVTVGALKWATGNLVAVDSCGCKVGVPRDGGLYFQFGSLIGWKGGALVNGGTGVGVNLHTTNNMYWNNAFWTTWDNDAMAWPVEMAGNRPARWPSNDGTTPGDRTGLSDYYFNYNAAPYSTNTQDIRGFAVPISDDMGAGTLADGRYAPLGVGDPCTYYLGAPWRQPTIAEYFALFDSKNPGTGWGLLPNWAWQGSPKGANSTSRGLFFPASGYRTFHAGGFHSVDDYGYYRASLVRNTTDGLILLFDKNTVFSQTMTYRSAGLPVRCVAE